MDLSYRPEVVGKCGGKEECVNTKVMHVAEDR